ncbi:hypothetical protein KAFR_0E02740 [Kazachstania africana CBS 2517]|uniref:Uncharacterized protein n=1 Tax=Kazachstania africana (strain ATCC 22294 / BCRC 22015 / CBS 2517 / CECT 1963 / NBRC 1671 / NRRL Y-8276) TaxID=1071382 RepID=H2AVM6_KAZAF|nr:hypothetical protein KAFR_0E02740 [Kazachstania africana CBS 2517]CCF58426.1 hypothetical protein KAFR_0E02740 [Kazachstania africana CBS 2517]
MDKYTALLSDVKFSTLTINVSRFPKTLSHWESLINYLITAASPMNKATDPRILKLIRSTYSSLLFHFPYAENYHIDYALLEYKLGNITGFHKSFKSALAVFNHRSILIWISYLRICNELTSDTKQLFKKYEEAESKIGLHFHSGEFWEMYLDQLWERCQSKLKYFIILRKVLEIPMYSFSKFFARWLRHVDETKDLDALKLFVPKDELLRKFKIDINYNGRRGPYLLEAKKILKKFTKETYMVVQYQVMELYQLFESKLHIHYYCSSETLFSSQEIETWMKYLDYTINLGEEKLTHLNFQRALIPLAHYDSIWIKYSSWLIERENDLLTAKNILLYSLTISLKKTNILELLYSILVKLNELDELTNILDTLSQSFDNKIEENSDFDIFWDFIQFQIFLNNSQRQSRYLTQSKFPLPDSLLDKVKKWLSYCEKREGQEVLLNYLVQLQSKENTEVIEKEIFQYLLDSRLSYYINNGTFWTLYCQLIYLDSSRSYLEKRRYIIRNILSQIPKENNKLLPPLLEFAQSYIPEDMDTLHELFE